MIMMKTIPVSKRHGFRQPGFTLIELLVVIAIKPFGYAYYFGTIDAIRNASAVPLIGDAFWMTAWPDPADVIPADRIKSGGSQIGVFSLNRHNKSLNLTFIDGSGRSVVVDKLKTLRWSTHRDWPVP